MSAGFGTENIVFVPAGESLRVFDLYNWRLLSLPVNRSSVRLRPHYLERLQKEFDSIGKELLKDSEDRTSQTTNRSHLREFAELVTSNSGQASSLNPDLPFIFGEKNKFWVRVSNKPCESFFTEDYQESATEPSDRFFPIQVYGSFSLEFDEQYEIPFPEEGENAAFEFELSSDGLMVEYIPLDEALPLVDEFCGLTGVSAHGCSVNLSATAEIVPTHQIAVPIRETDAHVFETLYFQFETTISKRVSIRLTSKNLLAWRNLLEEQGFAGISPHPACQIWMRDADVIHIYEGCEGKETQSIEVLPSFLICASSGGSKNPEHREHLLNLLLSSLTQST